MKQDTKDLLMVGGAFVGVLAFIGTVYVVGIYAIVRIVRFAWYGS